MEVPVHVSGQDRVQHIGIINEVFYTSKCVKELESVAAYFVSPERAVQNLNAVSWG